MDTDENGSQGQKSSNGQVRVSNVLDLPRVSGKLHDPRQKNSREEPVFRNIKRSQTAMRTLVKVCSTLLVFGGVPSSLRNPYRTIQSRKGFANDRGKNTYWPTG